VIGSLGLPIHIQ